MKTHIRLLRLSLPFLCCLLLSLSLAPLPAQTVPEESPEMIKQRIEWYIHQRAYPLKHIPAGARLEALRQLRIMRAKEKPGQPFASTSWILIGPEPTIPLLAEPFTGSPNVSGRVTALVVDPTNANVVYAGGADGGVWKTTDGGTSWTPLTDTQVSLSVGSIAIDPSNHNIIYVGTGEDNYGGQGGDAYYGAGILKSTDGGNTWTHLPGPFVGPLNSTQGGAYIGALAVSPANGQILLAGVALVGANGIYRSTDGGTNWTRVLSDPNGLDQGSGVLFDPTNGNNAFAALGNPSSDLNNGVYKSTNGGATWTAQLTASNGAPAGRAVIALAPSSPSTVYASFANSNDQTLLALFVTTNGGTSWTQLTATPNYCNTQCNYDNAIAVAPNNANVIFATGCYTYSTQSQTTVVRSLDGGATWALLGAGANGTNVHTDGHAVAFSADSGTVYVGTDGGVWKATDVTASSVNWTGLNSTLALTQFYNGMSVDPTNVNRGFGGAQDNGDQNYTGGLTWNVVAICGDGGFTAIDPVNPNTVYVTGHGPCVEKSTTGGGLNTFSNAAPMIATSDRVSFIPPFVIDPTNPSNLYLGANRLYQTTDAATNWNAISPDLTTGTGHVSAIAVAPNNSNTIYTGSDDAIVAVTTNALAGTGSSWFNISTTGATRAVTDIKVDATASTTAYVTYGGFSGFTDTVGHVFKTTNGGSTWTDISGNLPNIPVTSIAVDPDVANTLYVGTDIGAFATSNGGTTWSTLGSGLPTVGIMGLTFHHATRTLRAATHGRSAWDLSLANTPVLTSVVSRMTHGSITPAFKINFPLPPMASPRGVECRSSASLGARNYTMVFTFTNNLTSVASATVTGHDPTTGTGTVSSTAIGPNASLNLTANQYQVNLTNVSNGQYVTVTLNSVLDATGASGNVVSPQMGVLIGDVNATGLVDSGDVFLVRQQTSQSAGAGNFRDDVNATGLIDSGDVFVTRQHTSNSLPTPP